LRLLGIAGAGTLLPTLPVIETARFSDTRDEVELPQVVRRHQQRAGELAAHADLPIRTLLSSIRAAALALIRLKSRAASRRS